MTFIRDVACSVGHRAGTNEERKRHATQEPSASSQDSGVGEKWLDSGCTLKVDPTGFPDNSDIEYGVWSQPKMIPRFVSATGQVETPFTYAGKTVEEHICGKSQESRFGHI